MRAAKIYEDRNDVPTYRHEEFAAYQSGRDFDEALLERLDRIPEFVAACGFQNAKAPSFEAGDFFASAAKAEDSHARPWSDEAHVDRVYLEMTRNAHGPVACDPYRD
jgi:hypothetical protein